ncbi:MULTISPECIES: choice-of-anchor G family protein [Arthrobacter]|uniref:Choice-of-anchor G family protein n=2 Tax=Arthrobacter TaxID=1663 RepID=A0ABU9KLD6_9MICC|nr:choice-of-anchor G family protein [Arthrobacter sp. YJM1]MDP5227710.1 choice-of-anchor G family protein [Arthrobacter sp. YJM1]
MNLKKKAWPTAVAASAAVAIGLGFAGAPAAQAASTISQGNGQLLTGTLAATDLGLIAGNGGASAVFTDTTPGTSAESSTPLDLTVLSALNVGSGNIPLLGNNGVITLGAVGQYGQAVNDGSSQAFSGTVTGAPSLVTLPGGLPTSGNSALPAAEVKVSTAQILGGTNLVGVDFTTQTLSAAAKETVGSAPQGAYVVEGISADVDGTIVAGVATALNPVLNTASAALGAVGITLTNPLASGKVSITQQDLLDVAGVANINALPAGTDLVSYLPQAVANKITTIVNASLASVQTQLNAVSNLNPLKAAAVLALGTLNTAVTGILNGLTTTVVTPLGNALTALLSLKVNNQTANADGSWTQNALTAGIGSGLASVKLANATVGPNLDPAAIPAVNGDSLAISGGIALLLALGWLVIRKRRQTVAAAI